MKAMRILLLCSTMAIAGNAAASDMPADCPNATLAKLDTEAATLFEVRMTMPMLMGERGAAQDDNQAFTEQLAACGENADCKQSAYEARISALKDTLKAGMDEYCKLKGICG